MMMIMVVGVVMMMMMIKTTMSHGGQLSWKIFVYNIKTVTQISFPKACAMSGTVRLKGLSLGHCSYI